MTPLRRLVLLAVLLGVSAPWPAVAFALPSEPRASVRADDGADNDATDVDETDEADTPLAPLVAPASNPFCLVDEDVDGLDEVDSIIDEDPAYVEGDILDEEVGDEPVDLDGVLDFCSTGAVGGKAATGSLERALRGLTVPTDTMNISVPGTIMRKLRLSRAGLPKVLRPYAKSTLGSARKVARGDGFLDLPVRLDKTGRKALRKATGDVKLVLESTETLTSGQSRTRTQNILLER